MSIFEIFNQKEKSNIGKFECTFDKLADAFLSVTNFMGMSNPSAVTKTAGKAITIVKKKGGYVLSLNMFNPPIELKWTDLENVKDLSKVLDSYANTSTKIGYINQVSANGQSLYQLAIA